MGRTGRGWKKRKASCWFKPKNAYWTASHSSRLNNKLQTGDNISIKAPNRLTHQQFERTFKHSEGVWSPIAAEVLESTNQSSSGILLRPLVHEISQVEKTLNQREDTDEISGYIDVHLPTCVKVIQDQVTEHRQQFPECDGCLVTAVNLATKWGVSAMISLKCNTCKFVSSKQKLFREVPHAGRGRKSAEPNRSLALGLFNTRIATAGVQRLLSSMNKPTPSPSGLQKQLNKVGDNLQKLNESDMARQRAQLKDTLEFGGYARDTPIPAECDRQYNLSLRNSRRHTPFAPATQTRDVLVENLTPEKKIIAFSHENKLCKKGQVARANGFNVVCPGHTEIAQQRLVGLITAEMRSAEEGSWQRC